MVSTRIWMLVIGLSAFIHIAFAVGFKVDLLGETEKPAGPAVSVAGSLAGLMGQPGAVDTPNVEEVETAEPVELQEFTEATEVVEPVEAPEPDVTEAIAAKTISDAPVIEEVAVDAKPIETLKKPKSKPKVVKKKTIKKKVKKKKTVKKKKAKKKRKKSVAKRSGNKKKGASGKSRGGKKGKKRASAGSVRSYGSRVRARILSRRPRNVGKGRVTVSFGVTKSGGLRYARVSGGSASGATKRAALAAVRRSAPFPKPPAGASAGQLSFAISFTFR